MKLGTPVIFTATIEKVKEIVYGINFGSPCDTKHISKPCTLKQGIYIGYRFAANGRTTFYPEDGPVFKHMGLTKYYLVVINERENPIKVDPAFCQEAAK